ncbi:polyprenyl synthetase family protein [Sphingobacterium humi]|uniref:Polyprenyl synthetase family protein n=1 Tax=Sphingobacterium humi TaxID=1796905 RepID=A0A6N8L0U8_9SPHI|nr:polyprenyl synthetase family protein [Sphingobacterium humi]MVZ62937.1 polyprenyl synthetase family protein [Sphingobacterium humi]
MFEKHPYSILVSQYLQERSFPSTPAYLYDPIRYILSLGGKRIRPMLVLMSARLFGKEDLNDVLPASCAIEYFHNFSLLHDDIMDKAPLRRGQPTVHMQWNDNVAILSGDALLVKAYEELANSPAGKIPSLLRVFNQVALEVCEGQQMDMDFENQDAVSEAAYLNMIKLKTSVLLGGALKMGAILANASEEQQQLIYDFGVNLGIAFQLQDDFLDVYGDPSSFGKQVGGDILCDKKTILRIKTEELATGALRESFENLIGTVALSDEVKVAEMKKLYGLLAVDEYSTQLKEQYMQLAYNKLSSIDVAEQNKAELFALADMLMNRAK